MRNWLILRVLVIDNYDSFTYNLVHYLEEFCGSADVFRNDAIEVKDAEQYSHIIISPGPGLPKDAGITMKIIEEYHVIKKIFGVCLGMQAIAEYFGGELYNLEKVKHGVSSKCFIKDKNDPLYNGIYSPVEIGHYHSWVVKKPLPAELILTGENEEGIVMSLRHKKFPVCGVQYHPESLMTPFGKSIIKNFLLNF